MKLLLIILLVSLPPLPVYKKRLKATTTHGATQLLFKPTPLVVTNVPRTINIPFRYPPNLNTNSSDWTLMASSNLTSWFQYPWNWVYFGSNYITVTNSFPQMYFRISQP